MSPWGKRFLEKVDITAKGFFLSFSVFTIEDHQHAWIAHIMAESA
jgi:hypothetical protein